MSLRTPDLLFTAIAPAIWGSTYIVTTQYLPNFSPMTVAMLRALPAGLLLVMIVRQIPTGIWWMRIFILGALNISLFWSLLFISVYRIEHRLVVVEERRRVMERDRIGGAHHLGVLMHRGPEFRLQKIAGLLIAIFKQLIHRQDLILQRQIGGEVGGHDHQRRWLAGLLRRFGFDLGGVVVAGEDSAHFDILLRVVELLNDAGHLHGQLAVHRRREHKVYFLFRQRRAAQGKA